ncbi:MAG: tripartite tricarboxylate transporter TctB family protein [Clostridiales bacterium]|nr:tripartite tricarboxylate transporter TctB family protein [Clostridiales bacterium]
MKKDRLIGVISLIMCLVVFIAARQLKIPDSSSATGEPGPRMFPYIAAGLFFLSGIGLILQRQEEDEVFLNGKQWINLGKLLLVIIAYALGLYFVGFVIASPVMLFIAMTMMAGEKKVPLWVRIVYCILITGIIWLLFVRIFKTVLPSGLLF